jgi:hypothetical protein
MIADAVSQKVNPLDHYRRAVSVAAMTQSPSTTETRRDIIPQMLAVTRIYFGDRMGLVELAKRRYLQPPEPEVVRDLRRLMSSGRA